ncbi:hypothetical protein L5515_006864 [Caenorhabditis briggsae]|uniref:Uncharacterized protein n=1 Tax=Caenorhabditis briggsae TaxID=6238 RepID=A0AAE9JK02_CAEBR|nr:hypothetical protein L5515_006864 [Caenorhabditis briggsae]
MLQMVFFKCKILSPSTREDPFWAAIDDGLKKEGCKYKKEIFGATDSRFVRAQGIRAIGFSPIINTPSLLHDHNEFLNEKTYLRDVQIYENLINKLANVN